MVSFLLAIGALALAARWVAHAAVTAGIAPAVTAVITAVI
jgi:hypothetical protein